MKRFHDFLLENCFNEMGYKKGKIPLGEYENDKKMNTDVLLKKVDKALDRHDGDDWPETKIDVRKMVKSGELKATQGWLHKDGGPAREGVVPDLRAPILVGHKGKYHILDGHHRLNRALDKGKSEKVHLIGDKGFEENEEKK